ncbi:hypothetical protein D3C83_151250 [compost metagenome]
MTFERRFVFVPGERQVRLPPQAAEKVQLDPFFGETMLVVENLFLVVVALD